MGLISGFDYDVFVSYNHADDLRGQDPGEAGWVGGFAIELEKKLRDSLKTQSREVDRELKIFWDYQLERDHLLDGNLKQKVERSAMFLMIMSEHYLDSEWCKNELAWFNDVISSRQKTLVAIEDSSDWWPAIKVNVGPTAQSELADEALNNIVGFKFYDESRIGRGDPRYKYPTPAIKKLDDEFFWPEFNSLQGTLTARITKILEHQQRQQQKINAVDSSPKKSSSSHGVIVLATKDLEPERNQFKANFTDSGECLGEPHYLSGEMASATAGIYEQVSRSKVLVLLLGNNPSDEKASAAMRAALGSAKENAVPTFIWMKPGLAPEVFAVFPDELFKNYKALIEEVQADLMQTDFNQLTESILDKISKSADIGCPATGSKRVKLFIDAGSLDSQLADQVFELLNARGIQDKLEQRNVKLRTFSAPEGTDQRTHSETWDEMVKISDGVIIIYGNVQGPTISNKLDQIDRVSSIRNMGRQKDEQQGDIAVAILEGPPREKYRVAGPGLRILEGHQGIKEDQIIEFVSEVASRFP